MRCINSYGVSEVIGLVMVVMIAVSAISVIVFWGVPYIDSKKVSVRADSALTQFKTINDIIQRVSSEGINKSERVDFVTDAGQVSINKGERFILYYSLVDGFDFEPLALNDNDKIFTIQVNKIPQPLINPWDNSHYLRVDVYYIDEKRSDINVEPITKDIIIKPNVNYTYDKCNYNLDTAIRIDVKLTPLIGGPSNSDLLVGRIWLFDTGSISYDLSTSSGAYSVVAENEGVIQVSSGSGYLYYTPKIYHKDNLFTLRITRLQPSGPTGGSGTNTYKFLIKSIKSDNSSVQENKMYIPANSQFKIMIYGDENIIGAWADYFKSPKYGFTETNGVLSITGGLYFTLVYSVCDVLLTV